MIDPPSESELDDPCVCSAFDGDPHERGIDGCNYEPAYEGEGWSSGWGDHELVDPAG